MHCKYSLSGLLAVCLAFGFGCASADAALPDGDTAPDQGTRTEAGGELGSAEQAITLPLEEPSGSVQCAAACQRYSPANLSGLCCVCNGAIHEFARHPAIPNMYLCK